MALCAYEFTDVLKNTGRLVLIDRDFFI